MIATLRRGFFSPEYAAVVTTAAPVGLIQYFSFSPSPAAQILPKSFDKQYRTRNQSCSKYILVARLRRGRRLSSRTFFSCPRRPILYPLPDDRRRIIITPNAYTFSRTDDGRRSLSPLFVNGLARFVNVIKKNKRTRIYETGTKVVGSLAGVRFSLKLPASVFCRRDRTCAFRTGKTVASPLAGSENVIVVNLIERRADCWTNRACPPKIVGNGPAG